MEHYKNGEKIWRDMEVVAPSDKIACKDCVYRQADNEYVKGFKSAFCGIFEVKPKDVLFDDAECPYYVKGEK